MLRMNQNSDDHKRGVERGCQFDGVTVARWGGGVDSQTPPCMKREVSFLHGSLSLSPPALIGPEDGGGGSSGWGEVRGWVCVGVAEELEAGQREGQSLTLTPPRPSYGMKMSGVSPPSSHHSYNEVSTQ